jgi:hypothetical protein
MFDALPARITDRPAFLLFPGQDDQRALSADVLSLQQGRVCIEVNGERREVFVLALRHQLSDYRRLRRARSAPVCAEIEQYRLALSRKLVEFDLTVRLDLARAA